MLHHADNWLSIWHKQPELIDQFCVSLAELELSFKSENFTSENK